MKFLSSMHPAVLGAQFPRILIGVCAPTVFPAYVFSPTAAFSTRVWHHHVPTQRRAPPPRSAYGNFDIVWDHIFTKIYAAPGAPWDKLLPSTSAGRMLIDACDPVTVTVL